MDLALFVGNLQTVMSSCYLGKEFEQHLKRFAWVAKFWQRPGVVSAGCHAGSEQRLEYIRDQEPRPSGSTGAGNPRRTL